MPGILILGHCSQEESRRKAPGKRFRRYPETEILQGVAVQSHVVIGDE
jgi:hypothetical protein